jgi:uncharacterized membrane protein
MIIDTFAFHYEVEDPPKRRHITRDLPRVGIWFFFICGSALHSFEWSRGFMQDLDALILGLTSLASCLLFLQSSSQKTLCTAWMITCCLGGYFAEVIGVHTGYLFGSYYYGTVLGPAIWGVPLLMGFAWMKLMVLTFALASSLLRYPVRAALFGAFLATTYDIVLEQAALHLGYWTWLTAKIPLWNYICWFFISFLLLLPAMRWRIASHPFSAVLRDLFFTEEIYFLLIVILTRLFF